MTQSIVSSALQVPKDSQDNVLVLGLIDKDSLS